MTSRTPRTRPLPYLFRVLGKGVRGYIRVLMRNTRFSKKIRIDPKLLAWLWENKGKLKTVAGFLDIIINEYKNERRPKNKTNISD